MLTKRKLASIRRIVTVTPIEGADFIELAQVDGWQVVVKKGDFKEGDMCVYFEIDSFLPIEDKYEFLRKSSYKKTQDDREGFRLKTIRLRGQISQGLALTLKTFPKLKKVNIQYRMDLTDLLNVIKYVPYIPPNMAGVVEGGFPAFIPKTDEERIQNLPEFFSIHKHTSFEITEKLDGTSCTIYNIDGRMGVCSRNLELKITEENENNIYVKTAKDLGLFEALPKIGNYALQGEIVGEGIAGHKSNSLGIKGQKYYIYHIFDIAKQEYLLPCERQGLIKFIKDLSPEIEHVPILKTNIAVLQANENTDMLLKYAEGKSKINPDSLREGIVCKSMKHQNVTFKAINNDYLFGEE